MEEKKIIQKDLNGKVIKVWDSLKAINKEKPMFNISAIKDCCTGKRNCAHRSKWEFESGREADKNANKEAERTAETNAGGKE